MLKFHDFLCRPRYLRAIPSLVVLTTAMAWGASSDPAAKQIRASVLEQRSDASAAASWFDNQGLVKRR